MKKHILFVDDDPKILAGLRRSLRTLRNEWEMVFSEGGSAALEECARAPFDAVVSDARMPGMEGPVLLGKVMELYPDSARIILSGQCSRGSVLDCVAVAHQFLNKPCEPETLTSALQAVLKMRETFRDGATREAVSRAQWLPSQARLAMEIDLAIESSQTSAGELAGIIGRDVGMTAKVVQLVSSGFFGSPQHVGSAAEAVKLLGLETVRALFARRAELAPCSESCRDDDIELLNEHSFAVAAAARRIIETLTGDRALIGDAYLAGVLHEIGTLALTGLDRGGLGKGDVVTAPSGPGGWRGAPAHGEEACPDPGGYLAALWGLPDAVVQAIAFHRVPSLCRGQPLGPLTAVHVANAFLEQASDCVEIDDGRLAMDYLEQTGCADRLGRWRAICEESRLQGVAS